MKRRNYLRIGAIVVLLVLILIFQYTLSNSESFLGFYIRDIFLPLQKGRSNLLNGISVSLGDILYLLLALLLLLVLIRTLYFLFTFRKNKGDLLTESLRLVMLPLFIYFIFLLFWGGNYARKPLSASWDLEMLQWDTPALIDLNEQLVKGMNAEQQQPIVYSNLERTNVLANNLYHQRFGDRLPRLKVKPTSLGYMLNYLGIQGYYNPLSGEGQFNRFIPLFMHPFVVSHEMAHQAGIAAEDDANLLAYVLGAESSIPAFRYSAYFNLFLYAYSDLQVRDSIAARQIFAHLNQQSRNDMDTLRAMNRRYRSKFRRISTSLYDEYLRFHGQTEGINTYSDVTRWVYFREHAQKKEADLNVCP
ncbi:DUF3810 family protein [Taibaiella koreensis]|uniref:DUF3810 family protein n=1 Tax=Taibaiella koreensis TaxID=1268548 RepID=UPI000E59F578|nr:DUF3810 family protein [Taibaiella koreensis]